jgi:hypothetical protein
MQYLLLIHGDEGTWAGMSESERAAMYEEFGTYTAALREAGAMVGANQLQPSSTATTVRVQGGERIVTDGPFAETKEQLGGYFLIDVESVDDALDWAARIPTARYGPVEVRPVVPAPVEAAAP